MNKFRLLLVPMLWPLSLFATEPGQLSGEVRPPTPSQVQQRQQQAQPQPEVAPPPAESFVTHMNLSQEFGKARGLTQGEAQSLHFSRVSCDRRIYSQAGWSVEGDADLKFTTITNDLYEAEFPSYISLSTFDPYQKGIDRIDTVVSRQLVNFANWRDGRTLRLFKSVSISFMDPNKPKQTAYVMDEFKVIGDSYPPIFIVKETISTDKKFMFYFICH